MKSIFILFIVLIPFYGISQNVPPQNIMDSLHLHFTHEEIINMSSKERWKIIKGLRGLDTTHYRVAINEIKKVENSEFLIDEINTRVNLILEEKDGYVQKIFPNTKSDVINEFFGGLYKSYKSKEIDESKLLFISNHSIGEDIYSNISRRIYYFNRDGDLKLITLEYGYNINEGSKINWINKLPYLYKIHSYFVSNDTLQLYHGQVMEQRIESESSPNYSIMLDTTKVIYEEVKNYFSHGSSIRMLYGSSLIDKKDIENHTLSIPLKTYNDDINISEIPSILYTQGALIYNMLLHELKEFENNESDYLKPVPSSFTQPVIRK